MGMKKLYSIEAIDTQSSLFFDELVRECRTIRSSNMITDRTISGLREIIKKYTNLTTTITLQQGYNNFASGGIVDVNNVVLADVDKHLLASQRKTLGFDQYLDATGIKNRKTLIGEVDLKNSKVYKGYTKINFNIGLSIEIFKNKVFKDEHIAALLLHEVGHCFSDLMLLDQTVLYNQIMHNLLLNLTSGDRTDIKKRINKINLTLQSIGRNDRIQDLEEIAKKEDAIATEIILSKILFSSKTGDAGSEYISNTTGEQLADQFATRHCSGNVLAEAVLLVTKHHNTEQIEKLREAERIQLISSASQPFFKKLINYRLKDEESLKDDFVAKMMKKLYTEHKDLRYDTLKTRFDRIKRDLINQLKVPTLTKEVKEKIIMDIQSLDETLKRYQNDFNYKSTRLEASKDYRLGKDYSAKIEKLAANNLFVQAIRMELEL